MRVDYNIFLLLAAAGSGIAAFLHVGCIIFGANWYRFFGAGEKMARLAEAGSPVPTRITSVIVMVLLMWTYAALAGMGSVPKPPLLRYILIVIALIYLTRACFVHLLMKAMPGNSMRFWLWSSLICLALGAFYLIGTKQAWASL